VLFAPLASIGCKKKRCVKTRGGRGGPGPGPRPRSSSSSGHRAGLVGMQGAIGVWQPPEPGESHTAQFSPPTCWGRQIARRWWEGWAGSQPLVGTDAAARAGCVQHRAGQHLRRRPGGGAGQRVYAVMQPPFRLHQGTAVAAAVAGAQRRTADMTGARADVCREWREPMGRCPAHSQPTTTQYIRPRPRPRPAPLPRHPPLGWPP
jgi:hypothetical protein